MEIKAVTGFMPPSLLSIIDTEVIGSGNDRPSIPWYSWHNSCNNDSCQKMAHILISRCPNEATDIELSSYESRKASPYADLFIDVWRHILDAINENHNDFEILRMVLNLNFKIDGVSDGIGARHTDHDIDYKQIIVTLNDGFSGGGTIVYHQGQSVTLPPKKMTAYVFNSEEHAIIYPESGRRIVLVITYKNK